MLHYSLGIIHCVHKNVIIGCWLMNSVTLASTGLISTLNYLSSCSAFLSFLIFWLDKVWIQGFRFTKQILYHLSYTSSIFAFDIFGDGSSWNICTSPKTLRYEDKWILEKRNEYHGGRSISQHEQGHRFYHKHWKKLNYTKWYKQKNEWTKQVQMLIIHIKVQLFVLFLLLFFLVFSSYFKPTKQ
jgi:hypothetical protein